MKRLLCCLILVAVVSPARADNPTTGFIDRTFKNADGKESKYVLYVPASYKGDKAYPVILFLHGSVESGNDGKKQVTVGLGKAIADQKDFPFLVVFPQSEKRNWDANSEDGKRAVAILDEVCKEYKTDPNRIYLTGLSMGGFGTWSQAAKNPQRWAAIVPICGGGDPKTATTIKDLPCWCFHGAADKTVNVDRSRQMIEALKAAGGKPIYTEYPNVDHNSWDMAYANKELYEWLLKQQRKPTP
jgi:predicted peptidase